MDDYAALFPEDCAQYDEARRDFILLPEEDISGAYELAKVCWELANRWGEIAAMANRIAKEHGMPRSGLYDWAYRRYRLMLVAHEMSRMVWKQGKDSLRMGGT